MLSRGLLRGIRRILLTSKSLVTPANLVKLDDVLTGEAHLPVKVTWYFHREIIGAYQQGRSGEGTLRMIVKVIEALHMKIPDDLRPDLAHVSCLTRHPTL